MLCRKAGKLAAAETANELRDLQHADGAQFELIQLPLCGRGYGRCEAEIEADSAGMYLHCIKCDCIAPYRPAAVDRKTRNA
jgi:hypothetical protein